MRNCGATISSILFGKGEHVGVGRGLAEFRAGRPVLITGDSETLLALPVDGLDAHRLEAFAMLCAPDSPRLVITARRASTLGISAATPVAMQLAPGTDADAIVALVAEAKASHVGAAEPARPASTAAVDLAKLVHLLPAVLTAKTTARRIAAFNPPLVTVEAEAVARFRAEATRSLTIAGEASVPVSSSVTTRFVVFRDSFGDTPVAVVVGNPEASLPVPVRLHSACLTGDVFGSRRCDCGDQLKLSMTRLQEMGGGVILYLAQEGRGLGLPNKMRTYQLQDAGLDTVDANTTLGFDDDERDYGTAVRMLQILGYTRVVLLTNSPAKLDSLAKSGIEIAGRMPLEAPIHSDNRRYLTAKATRNGHHLAHVLAAFSEAPSVEARTSELTR